MIATKIDSLHLFPTHRGTYFFQGSLCQKNPFFQKKLEIFYFCISDEFFKLRSLTSPWISYVPRFKSLYLEDNNFILCSRDMMKFYLGMCGNTYDNIVDFAAEIFVRNVVCQVPKFTFEGTTMQIKCNHSVSLFLKHYTNLPPLKFG